MTTRANTGEQLREISQSLKQDQRNYLHEVEQGKARIAELEAELAALKAKAAVPDGWKLVAVNGSFSDLMYYLDRASVKGYLDRLYDLVEPWEAFDYEYIENAAAPSQPQSDDAVDGLVDAVKDVLDHLNDGHSIHSGTGLHSCLQAAYRALLGGDHE